MGFENRLAQANTLITVLNAHIWQVPPCKGRLTVVPYGYETHVSDAVRQQMRSLRTTTSRHIRFTPDFFILDRQYPDRLYLFEYKVTQTPRYNTNWISGIGRKKGIPDLTWENFAQMEAEAYDNYMALHTLGARVVVLNYCAYHPRLLLCDYIEKIQELHRDQVRAGTATGSGTPFINFDARSLRTLTEFLATEHGIQVDPVVYAQVCSTLAAELKIKHNSKSPFHPDNQSHPLR